MARSAALQPVVRFICVLLMIQCTFVTFTGRGIIAIIQGIVGVIFSIEGFWGAVKVDQLIMRRFLFFLFFYLCLSIVIGIINLRTLDDYCRTAQPREKKHCEEVALIYGYLNLLSGCVIEPIYFVVVGLFYKSIVREQGGRVQDAQDAQLRGYLQASAPFSHDADDD